MMSEWISVKDRLPEGGKLMLFFTTDKRIKIDGLLRLATSEAVELLGFTHWMPLPEPPKEQGDV